MDPYAYNVPKSRGYSGGNKSCCLATGAERQFGGTGTGRHRHGTVPYTVSDPSDGTCLQSRDLLILRLPN